MDITQNYKELAIKSYLAHAITGKKQELLKALNELNQCEVTPAENEDIIVLVTDTLDDNEEEILKEKLESILSLKMLSLVSGFNAPLNK